MHPEAPYGEEHPVLIFDGVCNLCEWLVIFIVNRDRTSRFRFATAQSEVGQWIQDQNDVDAIESSTMILIKNGHLFTKSDAAIEIAKSLDGLWKFLAILVIFPKPVRDSVYTWIGNHRYRWFGMKDQCLLPTAELESRFLG